MKPDSRIKPYAAALMAVARETDSERAVHNSLKELQRILKTVPQFRVLFLSRRIDPIRKGEVLEAVLGEFIHPAVVQFIKIVPAVQDWETFQALVRRVEQIYRRTREWTPVTAFTAQALEEGELRELKADLERALDKSTDLRVEVDPDLIGGIRLRIGNIFLDGSIKSRLDKLGRTLLPT